MKISKLADKIIVYCVKQYYKTGDPLWDLDSIVTQFPDENRFAICDAIRMLGKDGFLKVHYADNEPNQFEVMMLAIQSVDQDTLLRKGYMFAKAIKELL